MSIDLRRLLDAGELHRLALECKSQGELARRIGITSDAYELRIKRMRARGEHWPTLAELQSGGHSQFANSERDNDFSDEGPTLPGVPDLGSVEPNLGSSCSDQTIPAGHRVHGTSTLVDASGATVMQWIKTSTSREQYQEALIEALSDPLTWLRGQAEPIDPPPAFDSDDLLTVFGLGDAHLGMQAWHEETGDNFDLQIATRDIRTAIDGLVAMVPPSKHAIVLSVGDLVHFDNESKTTTAGTRQDADSRWSKVMRAAIATMRYCTDRALTKFENVNTRCLLGNHDRMSSMAVALALAAFYERDPRVDVSISPNPYTFRRFGKVLLGFCHGDEAKIEKLPLIMACDAREDWGDTEHREFLTGHVHHVSTKEFPGCTVKTLRTLATSDRWHHGAGYRSGGEMIAMTYHRLHGLVETRTIGLSQVRSRLA